ncbi:5'-nucleotidase [methanogenic archaeon mixed culture ISO4-G1]|nr:5'-nucleotidase [methanogenic archaeon mixed culture ISO4-G1]
MISRKVVVAVVAVALALCAVVVIVNPFGGGLNASFVIIHTNDTHCFYEGDDQLNFSTVAALREQYSEDNVVFTVDAGDFLQGTPTGP